MSAICGHAPKDEDFFIEIVGLLALTEDVRIDFDSEVIQMEDCEWIALVLQHKPFSDDAVVLSRFTGDTCFTPEEIRESHGNYARNYRLRVEGMVTVLLNKPFSDDAVTDRFSV